MTLRKGSFDWWSNVYPFWRTARYLSSSSAWQALTVELESLAGTNCQNPLEGDAVAETFTSSVLQDFTWQVTRTHRKISRMRKAEYKLDYAWVR